MIQSLKNSCYMYMNYIQKIAYTLLSKIYLLKTHQKFILHKTVPETFGFDTISNPLVSIIIPVYNQYQWTIKCLYTIKQNITNVPYEIIIADDCSTDQTTVITQYIQNIRIIKTKQNSGFLRNCNNAFPYAKGKYIWFLNNDTQIKPNALQPMLDLFAQKKDTGAVGSKLLYPSGILQEAGGIIFLDATGLNYGILHSPFSQKYNYVKEVDFCTGASLLVSKELFSELNGFDEFFLPAYYEETDLCFRIRQKGYKVYYQPMSEVIHFESVSLKESHKELMQINREKFQKKWSTVLQTQLTAKDIFLARDRTQNKRVMLFIDMEILKPDTNCGSRSSQQYIQKFLDSNFSIIFMPLFNCIDYQKDAKYIKTLTQMGVEIIDKAFFESPKNCLARWLKKNGKYLSYVFINRPAMWKKSYALIKKYANNARIIFQGHDIHYLRNQRMLETTKKNSIDSFLMKIAIQHTKQLEESIWKKADTIFYFSDIETETVKKTVSNAQAYTVPLFLYKEAPKILYTPSKRNDLLFVGGFSHMPNADAMMWFTTEILPLIVNTLPTIKLHLVGSNIPKTFAAKNPNVFIHGFVSDLELEELYKTVRLVISPLRYGAGIKGKIVEAMMHQVPVITTTIGAEGIYSELLTVADTAQDFSQKLVTLYNDFDSLLSISNKSLEFVTKNYTQESFDFIFEKFFN